MGVIEPPASVRELTRASFLALFANGETTLSNLPRCQATEELVAFLKGFYPGARRDADTLVIPGTNGFAGEGLGQEVALAGGPEMVETLAPLFFQRGARFSGETASLTPRFRGALKILDRAGFSFSLTEADGRYLLEILKSSPDSVEIELDQGDEAVKTVCLSALLSAATGANRVIETVPGPAGVEALLKDFGADITALRKGDPASDENGVEEEVSELEKRIRRLQAKKDKGGERPFRIIHVVQNSGLKSVNRKLSGDVLLAAPFILSGMLMRDSSITVTGVPAAEMNGLLTVFRRMGASIQTKSERGRELPEWLVQSSKLQGRRISGENTAALGPLFPFVAVAAAFAEGQTVVRDGMYLREGPVDLIECTLKNLKAMGVKAGEIDDGLVIEGAREYDGAELDSMGVPGLALALASAAARNRGESVIKGAEAVDRLWPDFFFKFEGMMEKME